MGENFLVCPGVDVEKFQRSCRLPLARGRWNYWRVVRTQRDGATEGHVLSGAPPSVSALSGAIAGVYYVLDWWLSKLVAKPRLWTDIYRNVEATLSPPSDVKLTELASLFDQTRIFSCPYAVTVANAPQFGNQFDIWVGFVYEGSAEDMPWPCYQDARFLVAGYEEWCPIEADYAVVEAFVAAEREVPARPSLPGLPALIDPGASWSGVAFWGVVIGGAAIITAYALSSRARSVLE